MKCTIPALNIKVLGRAVHSLAKIGDELHIEPLKEGLSFRTVNSSRSAYASFIFSTSFFSYYKYEVNDSSDGENEDIKCKISMKSCLNVFRTSTSLDKNVETCQLRLDSAEENLIFELRCRYGITKIYYLPIIECEALQAVYTKDNVPNKLTADAKFLVDAVQNFQIAHDEITFMVDPQNITLTNYVENIPDPKKVIRTELNLKSGEFDVYCVPEKTSITFRLKELRALLLFAENVNLPISVNFETTGRPVVFVIKSNTFEANFVLATLADIDTLSNCSQATSVSKPAVSLQNRNSVSSRKDSIHENGKRLGSNNKLSVDSRVHSRRRPSKISSDFDGPSSQRSVDLFSMPHEETSTSRGQGNEEQIDGMSVDRRRFVEDLCLDEINPDGNDEIMVPRTPTPPLLKKGKFVFKRCFESTFNPREIPGYDDVLADDSADEET